MYYWAPSSMDISFMSCALIIALTSIILHCKNSLSEYFDLSHLYLRHSFFFLICFIITFYQYDIDYVLGLCSVSDLVWFRKSVVCKSLVVSNLALISCFLGYQVFKWREYQTTEVEECSYDLTTITKKYLLLSTLVLLLIYYVFVPKEFLQNGYVNHVDDGAVGGLIQYIMAFLIAVFVLYSIDYKRNEYNSWLLNMKYPLILVFLYVILVLASGRRTEALRAASLVLVAYLYAKGKSLNYKKLVLFGLCGMFVFSIVGKIRTIADGDVFAGAKLISEYSSVSPFTKELAGSVLTLHVAEYYFPDKLDYTLGSSFFPGFLKLIPGSYHIFDYFVDTTDSGTMLTNLYFSGKPAYGLGSSIVADVYIAFGIIGVVAIFLMLGAFLRYLEVGTFAVRKSPYFLALSFGCFSQFLLACRANISIMFLCLTYSCIIIFIFRKVRWK